MRLTLPNFTLALAMYLTCHCASAHAPGAVVIFDATDGSVITAHAANRPSAPASLTKLMTVHLVFDALKANTLSLEDRFLVSAIAARQPPKVTGLKEGESVTIEELLLAIVVTSGNDAAVAAAEALAKDEQSFVERMNEKARQLGMTSTHFRNASGLPDIGQVTTARDIAVLSRSLLLEHKQRFELFSRLSFELNGRSLRSHNSFLRSYAGSTGMKTGFTCRAGYNLAAAARRDGRVLMGVVLGSETSAARYASMTDHFNAAFSKSGAETNPLTLAALPQQSNQGARDRLNQSFIADACLSPRRTQNLHAVSDWSLEFGLEVERDAAVSLAETFIREHRSSLKSGHTLLIPRWARDIIYRVAVTGLSYATALNTCKQLRARSEHCIVLSETTAQLTVDQALRTLEWKAANPQGEQENTDDE
jgi:D-alanyl-D-alanine carboxypeptidase